MDNSSRDQVAVVRNVDLRDLSCTRQLPASILAAASDVTVYKCKSKMSCVSKKQHSGLSSSIESSGYVLISIESQ
jgi:hypothetical protein